MGHRMQETMYGSKEEGKAEREITICSLETVRGRVGRHRRGKQCGECLVQCVGRAVYYVSVSVWGCCLFCGLSAAVRRGGQCIMCLPECGTLRHVCKYETRLCTPASPHTHLSARRAKLSVLFECLLSTWASIKRLFSC